MAVDDVETFLNEQGTGVLCLARESRAYGIPIAFAYDADGERAILDLGFAPESRKREFVDATDEVCLTVYEHDAPDDWTSVVLSGELVALEEDEIGEETESWFHEVAGDIDVDASELELQWYELVAETVSGRVQ
ncbi:pyridoxamine 5'-phosphate oxidase family protein [Natrialbaceae archaeon AArc-T1-2]|uniref:pyridoxamine 5'-phosphate oxidase family protein n=1 Tax=Natrialbaceae archaeon AArc-T1-2 TaxID=3053904 RepID=UPI00255B0DAE|nr:pyridoxamine 5'-phosphate oxidase family protein [Natrialbaceae archaeon AArc-T1-2]WIV68469.1 pyridoxamine 5'-phosphate oxidase family protein [Natrialbaceae archaeon AArc-T1-2]